MFDDQRDFVARQYANLVAQGLDDESIRTRLRDVLGAQAVESLGDSDTGVGTRSAADVGIARQLAEVASRLGGTASIAHAELIHSLAEAQRFALDWWRPIRTFLLYALFLLGMAVVIAIIYLYFVLPAFSALDQTMDVHDSTVGWIAAHGALRLFAPLIVMATVFAVLAIRWSRMRQRIAKLDPLANRSRFGWGRSRTGTAFQALRCLEFAAAIKAAGVADAAVLEPALQAAGWPRDEAFQVGANLLGEKLQQADRLGTFDAELEWQRQVHWSMCQAQLELSRDRLILLSRVLFYILIGSMVTVLYLPIFSVASMIGAQ